MRTSQMFSGLLRFFSRKGLCAIVVALSGAAEVGANQPAFSVLIFSKTTGFRHQSIAAGIAAMRTLASENNFRVDTSEDSRKFTDGDLAKFQAIVFLNTSGTILNPQEKAAFKRFIRNGGGYVGIHSASDTEHDWPWYGKLVGTYFRSHPAVQPALLRVMDASHDSTRHLPAGWTRTDEWYNFTRPLAPDITILIRIDEGSYTGGTMDADHPIAWYHAYQGGRAWYTAIGHTADSFSEPLVLRHLLGGIRWAAGVSAR